jgi:hypothetical protein
MRDRDEAKRKATAKQTVDVVRPGKATQAERVAEYGDVVAVARQNQFHTIRAGALYTDDGAPIPSGDVPAHQQVVISGKLATITQRGECVLASYDGRSGWMQVSCLPAVATREIAPASSAGKGSALARESRRSIRKRKRDDDDDADYLLIEWPEAGKADIEAMSLDDFVEFFVDEMVEQRALPIGSFAYGYVVDGDGEHVYGWIDAALLL